MTNYLTVILSLAVKTLKAYFCWTIILRSLCLQGVLLIHSRLPLAVRVNETLFQESLTLRYTMYEDFSETSMNKSIDTNEQIKMLKGSRGIKTCMV